MLREIRRSIATLAKDRAFSLIAFLTLAVAIGANSAIFSVIHAVLIAPMPYAAPERLVVMYNLYPGVGVTSRGANAVPDYFDRRAETDTFEHVALIDSTDRAVGAEGAPQQMGTLRVTPSFFPLLGAAPALGRTFTEDDATLGNERVAILTHGLWQQQYAGAVDVLGKEIRIDRVAYQIVGVMPPRFLPPDPDAKILLPFAFTDEQKAPDNHHSNFASMLARLKPGVSLALAQQRIDALNERLMEQQPQGMRELLKNAGFHTAVVFFKDEVVRDVRSQLWLVQGGVALMLAIGCVNIANLMLIRAQKRKRELAVRTALGAGRGRLVREMLTETLVLATAGGLAGIGIAWLLTNSLAGFIAEQLPRGASVGLSPTVLAFTAGLSLATGLLFGLIPALAALRSDPAQVLREAGRSGTAGRGAALTRSSLVVAQFSFAFVLLILSGLLVLSFRKVTAIEPGFASGGVLTARLSLPQARYADDAQLRELTAALERDLAALPGVASVGITSSLPFGGSNNASAISIEGQVLGAGEGPPVPLWNEVNAGFFSTLEIPLLAGSVFAKTDTDGAALAVIVDQQFATRYFPAGDALGKRLRRGVGDEDANNPWWTIVGVVGTIRALDLTEPSTVGALYFPLLQSPNRALGLAVRAKGDPEALTASVRTAVARLDPELPLFEVQTLESRVAESLTVRRAPMLLLGVFAGVSLLLSAIGIYGVIAYSVSQRRKEMGIRAALGAAPSKLASFVLAQGGRLIALGVVFGIAGALAAGRFLRSLLYGVEASDPLTFLGTAVALATVGFTACLAPSLAAARVPPSEVLAGE